MKPQKMNLPDELQEKLHKVQKRWVKVHFTRLILLSLAVFFASLVIMYISDRLWDTAPIVRLILLLITLGSFLNALISFIKLKSAHTRTPYKLIELVQKEYAFLGDSLQGAVELSNADQRPANISQSLCEAAVRQVAASSEKLDFDKSIKTDSRNKDAKYFLGFALIITLFFIADKEALKNTMNRWIKPFGADTRYTFVQFEKLPTEKTVLHGEAFTVDISIKADSRLEPQTLKWHFSGLTVKNVEFKDGKITLALPGQMSDTILTVGALDYQKEIYIKTVHRPALSNLHVKVKMPDYLQYPDSVKELHGTTAEFIKGSQLVLQGEITNALQQVMIKTSDKTNAVLSSKINGRKFHSEEIHLLNDTQLSLDWIDKYANAAREKFAVQLSALEDEAPWVECGNVSRQFAILASRNVKFPIVAEDRHGVKYLKVIYSVNDIKNPNFSRSFTFDIKEGSPENKKLQGTFLFSPNQLNIVPGSTVTVQAVCNDYFPGRKPVLSAEYTIYVLNNEQHAKLLEERFEALMSRLEDATMQEDENMQKNIQISEMSPEDLNSEKGRKAIEGSLAAEESNARFLEDLIEAGEDLVREALNNEDFSETQLKEWMDTMEELEELVEEDMEEVKDKLSEAGGPASESDATLRLEGLQAAIKKQEEVLRQLERLSKESDENVKKAVLKNFAARLRKLSKLQDDTAEKMVRLFIKSPGMAFEHLPENLKKLNSAIFDDEKKVVATLKLIHQEIQSFYTRTKVEAYKKVSDDIEAREVFDKLADLIQLILSNRCGVAHQPVREWALQFVAWAEMLDPKNDAEEEQDPYETEEGPEDDKEFLLALIRVIEEEQALHDETIFVEDTLKSELKKRAGKDEKSIVQRQEANSNHDKAVKKLADRQKENSAQLLSLMEQLRPGKVRELMKAAVAAMQQALEGLNKQVSGVKVSGAQAAAVELLIRIFLGEGGGKSGSNAQSMISMLGSGNSPGGNNSGGPAAIPINVDSTKFGDKAISKEGAKRNSSVQLDDVPQEYRQALESYYREVEKIID